MTISISVRGFRGCSTADLDCAPIALVAGANGAGKSSIAQAAAAALAGNSLLGEFGLLKKDAGRVVRRGAKTASVKIEADDARAEMTWPEGKLAIHGAAPQASVYATGIASLVTLPVKERAAALAGYIKATPDKGDLAREMGDGFTPEVVDLVWAAIEKGGWDGAAQQRREHRAQAAGAWEQITGEKFGSAKAKDWTPDGWDERHTDTEALERQLAEAKKALDAAVGDAAVGKAELDALKTTAATLDERNTTVATAKAGLAEAEQGLAQAQQAAQGLPGPVNAEGLRCPHCDGQVLIAGVGADQHLEKFAPVPDKENEARRGAIREAASVVELAKATVQELRGKVASATAALAQAMDAKTALDRETGKTGSAEAVERARQAVDLAQGRLTAALKQRDATIAAGKWQANDTLAKILDPAGLRARKLGEAVRAWNEIGLAPLCAASGWAPVTIDEEFTVSYGGTPYPLLSASEQMRVRIVLQVAMAKSDGSAMLVVDGADMLDAAGRNGLFRLVRDAQLPALVAMTFSRVDQVPDIAAPGFGATYWVEGGVTLPLADAKARAAQQQAA